MHIHILLLNLLKYLHTLLFLLHILLIDTTAVECAMRSAYLMHMRFLQILP